MLGTQDFTTLIGRKVYSTDGQKIGELRQVYLDDRTEQLQFITVNTGLFGTSESFVPASDASATGDGVTVPFDKDKVKNAPKIDADGHISPEQEQEIHAYYGLAHAGYGTGDLDTHGTDHLDTHGTVGHDTSGPTTDEPMTRSEEQLHVGTQRHESGRVRLRKWVETEQQQLTVPVSRERAVLEREVVTDVDVDHALSGKAISEEEHEIVLHEERAVVEKTVTPVERVRLDTEVVTEQQVVADEVRKERIEVEGDVDPR
jgi:uncharacterized protein (TIGR02271 family)